MNPKNILAIETSTRRPSVALVCDEGGALERRLEGDAFQGRQLAPCVQELFVESGLDPLSVDLVAVGLGPGSYTGLRVGIALARSFAFVAGCGLAGVSSFAALAFSCGTPGAEVLCVGGAGSGEFYSALFKIEKNGAVLLGRHAIGSRQEVASLACEGRIVAGEGADEILGRESSGRLGSTGLPWAADVAVVGRREFIEHGSTPPDKVLPLYLRRSKAEINWELREEEKA